IHFFYGLILDRNRSVTKSISLIDFRAQSIFLINISSSVNCQFRVLWCKRVVIWFIIIAAETEIFKLSVKPYIGILIKVSAAFITSSESPVFSVPKKIADGFVMSKSLSK